MRTWPSRKSLDAVFPTIVRYAGLVLLTYGAWTRNPATVTAGTGMIFFKNVYGNGGKE